MLMNERLGLRALGAGRGGAGDDGKKKSMARYGVGSGGKGGFQGQQAPGWGKERIQRSSRPPGAGGKGRRSRFKGHSTPRGFGLEEEEG